MKTKSQSVKGQLLTAFSVFTSAILFIALVSYININRANKASERDKEIHSLKIQFLELVSMDRDFFDFESMNENFYQSKESSLLTRRDYLYHQIKDTINQIIQSDNPSDNLQLEKKLTAIQSSIEDYSVIMSIITEKIYLRGFRDEGMEGKMRNYAHEIEKYKSIIPQSSILMLRRHEKDYFLRNDSAYVVSFNKLIDSLKANMRNNPKVESLLLNYQKLFNRIVALEYELGFNDFTGRKKELHDMKSEIDDQFQKLFEISNAELVYINKKSRLYIYTTIAFSIISAIFLSILIARKIGKPLENLSSAMNGYSKNKKFEYSPTRSDVFEIQYLEDSFYNLMQTTSKQMEEIKDTNTELKKVNNELDLFVYSTAHDLKAPLSSILGLVEVMRMENKDHSMEPYYTMMKSSVHKLNDFIKDIVDYGKNNRLDVSKLKVDFDPLVTEIINNYRYLSNFEKLDISISIDKNISIYSDPKRLNIILRNLISNSIRYADLKKENPYVKIEVRGSNNVFQILVSDNGIGIEKQHFSKLFDMFYRANPDSKGSGIGLFIVKETVEKLDGSIQFDSKVWEGTKFSITLPNHFEKSTMVDSRLIKEGFSIR